MHIKKILTFLASAIITWLPVGAEDIRFIGDDNLIYRIDTETVHAEILGVKTGVKLTGEVNSIRIGDCVNIQDGSVLHTLYQKSTIEIGNHVSIGHNVVIHGAKIHDYALIGMGAVVMDDAEVGEGALVAAATKAVKKSH